MNNITNPIISVVDNETGEILTEIYKGDRVKIERENQIKYVNTHIIDFCIDHSFVKIFECVIPELYNSLSNSEFSFLLRLTDMISYDDCVIRDIKNKKSRKPLNLPSISEKIGVNYNNARKLIKSLSKKDIIKTCEIDDCKRAYVLNPYVFFRGSDCNKKTESLFENSKWKLLHFTPGIDKEE